MTELLSIVIAVTLIVVLFLLYGSATALIGQLVASVFSRKSRELLRGRSGKSIGRGVISLLILIGLGAAVMWAVPSRELYSLRAKVSEGFQLAMPVKMVIAEFHRRHKRFPNNDLEAGLSSQDSQKPLYTKSIELSGEGKVLMTFRNVQGWPSDVAGATVLFVATAKNGKQIVWDCTGGSLPSKFRPKECRP